MKCGACGHELNVDAIFCSRCGNRIDAPITTFEFVEKFIDLSVLNIKVVQGYPHQQHAAWQKCSPTVMAELSRMGADGWELVEPALNFSVLETVS